MGGLTPGDAEGSKIGIKAVHSEEIYVIRLSNADEIVAEHDDDGEDNDNDNDEDAEREKEGFGDVVGLPRLGFVVVTIFSSF